MASMRAEDVAQLLVQFLEINHWHMLRFVRAGPKNLDSWISEVSA